MSTPAANAATTSFTPIEASGDTSGATDWNAIQSVLNAGQGAAAWLAGGTFYVNQTITFKASQQSILGQGRRVTTIVAADGFTGTQTGTTVISGGATLPATAVIYTGSDNQLNGLQQTGGAIRGQFTNLHFLSLNGWPFSFDGQGGNNAGMFIANALAGNCFGVAYLQGNVEVTTARGR